MVHFWASGAHSPRKRGHREPSAVSHSAVNHNALSRRGFLQAALALGGVALGGTAAAGAVVGSVAGTPRTPRNSAGGDQGQHLTAQGSTPGSADTLVIGFVPIACASPLLAADALGAFTRRGLNVRLRKYAGWADLWTAYATGVLDVAHMLSPMPIALDAGSTSAARPTELAFTQNTNGQALTLGAQHVPENAGPGKGVRTPADLRGKVLGIPFEYSVHALLLRDYLASNGVDPVSEVELRLLRPPDMVAQLAVGTIDGFIGPEPFNQRALATNSGRIFVPTKQMWNNHPCCSVAVAKDIPTPLRDLLVDALREGASFVNSPAHIPEAAPMLAQEKYLNQAETLLAPALAGEYTDWDGNEHTDPEMLNFGSPTSATAITWMSAQMARWDLGGDNLRWDDASIIEAARAVLPKEAEMAMDPVDINGRTFDPQRPTKEAA